MNDEQDITEEDFDRLLRWLDREHVQAGAEYDPERAGARYEKIRRRIISFFTCRGCREAEEQTDITFSRVTVEVREVADTWVGPPEPLFFAVAKFVMKEYRRTRPAPPPPPARRPTEEVEREYECFDNCMKQLPAPHRDLILRYYHGVLRAKINHRQKMADEMGIALNALRIRAHRIRAALEKCVRACLAEKAA